MNSSSTEKANRAAIYCKAARRIEKGEDFACCHALDHAGGQDELEVMADLFCADNNDQWPGHWMAEHHEDRYGRCVEVQDRRVLALCLMAAMVEAGDA